MRTIQTEYRGYHFRSRTEAKWAVFFDKLGVAWQYEPEGFEMADGTRYLPDFFLPNLGKFAEVKGPEGYSELAFAKAIKFASAGRSILCLPGAPDDTVYKLLEPEFDGGECIGYNGRLYRFQSSTFASVRSAVRAARSARFEFGQSGATL